VPLKIVEHFTAVCHCPSQCQHGIGFLIVASPGDKRNDMLKGFYPPNWVFSGLLV